MHRMHPILVLCSLFILNFVVLAQVPSPKLPCDFSGQLLRDAHGRIERFTPEEMKKRATAKADVNGFIMQLDISTVVLVNVLVNRSGQVVCAKSLSGMLGVRKPVETALQSWRFKPAMFNGRPVAYLGLMRFALCNMGCGEEEPSNSLLK
jgi:hypothetical protein